MSLIEDTQTEKNGLKKTKRKRQTMIYETLHMVPKIEREPHKNRYTKLLLTGSASMYLVGYLQISSLMIGKKKPSASVSSHINSCYFKEYVTGDAKYPFRQFYTKLLETSCGVVLMILIVLLTVESAIVSNKFYVILYRH